MEMRYAYHQCHRKEVCGAPEKNAADGSLLGPHQHGENPICGFYPRKREPRRMVPSPFDTKELTSPYHLTISPTVERGKQYCNARPAYFDTIRILCLG